MLFYWLLMVENIVFCILFKEWVKVFDYGCVCYIDIRFLNYFFFMLVNLFGDVLYLFYYFLNFVCWIYFCLVYYNSNVCKKVFFFVFCDKNYIFFSNDNVFFMFKVKLV